MEKRLPYIPYNPALKERAREMRNSMTIAERKLWFEFLRSHSVRWLRQKPLGEYIVDFYCSEKNMVIEVDGDSHFTDAGQEYDMRRTKFLSNYGLRVIRFTNLDVLQRFDAVCISIDEACKR
jgi:very-short-patch-repair endonuclease